MPKNFKFPVDIGGGTTVEPENIALYYDQTEVERAGGYYPLGTNTVWHGGLHIHTDKPGTPIYACADGVIVAASLAETKKKAHAHYGSCSFILIRHLFHGAKPNYKNTLIEGHRLQRELERKYQNKDNPGDRYRDPFDGYNKSTAAIANKGPKYVDDSDRYVCSTCSAKVLERSGYQKCASGETVYKRVNIFGIPSPELKDAVDDSSNAKHGWTKGVVYALLTAEAAEGIPVQGTEIDDFDDLLPGDFVEYWWKTGSYPWRGGHAVQVDEHFGKGMVKVHSSHKSTKGICVLPSTIDLNTKHKAYAVRPSGNRTEIYYSLYIHLNNGQIEGADGYLNKVKWLEKWVGGKNTVTVKGSSKMYWVYEGTTKAPKEIGEFTEGSHLTKKKTVGSWEKVRFRTDDPNVSFNNPSGGDHALAYVAATALKAHNDTSKISDLRDGKVVEPNITVEAGEQIWESGEYGSPGYRGNLVHWEIFSENNLFPPDQFSDWKQVEDDDEDFTMDCEKILNMVEQEWFGLNSVLTFEEIKDFYSSQNTKVRELRRTACKFITEWGIPDLQKAIDNLRGTWFTGHLEEHIRPYLWWTKSKALPQEKSKRKVWHYNPIAVLEQLADYYKFW